MNESNNTAKHTPGPWLSVKYTKGKFGLGNPGDSAWMMLSPVYTDTSDEEMRANARLIAAAPELLEALQAMLNEDDGGYAADKARASIKKATGGTGHE